MPPNNNSKSIGIMDDKLKVERLNKLNQTPDIIPEPEYKYPFLSRYLDTEL